MALPVLLAGPVVRRAEPDRVYVWAATSREVTLEATVHELERRTAGSPTVGAQLSRWSQTLSVRLGERLWVHLAAAAARPPPQVAAGPITERTVRSPVPVFPTGRLLAYDLRDTRTGDRLAAWIRLTDVACPGFPLPSFVLQPPQGRLHLVYASCRKPHGEGEDALLAADAMLQRHASEPDQRLSALILGGDQIYADDVADLLARPLSELAFELTGRREVIPGLQAPHGIPIRGRGEPISQIGKFTSGEAGNHLFTFGEFAAMYLLAWNPDVWPSALPSAVDTYAQMADRHRPRPSYEWYRTEAPRQLEALRGYQAASGAARRLMANTPTYMIFDDHEVTDDWNLNAGWTSDVLGSSAGRRVMLNGLAAYWAFQGWGNEPYDFPDRTFISPVQRFCVTGGAGEREAQQALLGQRWSFTAPTHPPTVVLNARTQRDQTRTRLDIRDGAPRPRNNRAPRLLNAQERARVTQLLAPSTAAPVIVVAPTPVFGVDTIEFIQTTLGWYSAPAADLESWRANPMSFVDAARLLLRAWPSTAIVLSGDVHYAFQAAARLRGGGRSVPVAQFTSSATKNETRGARGVAATVLGMRQPLQPQERRWWLPPGEADGITTTASDIATSLAVRLALGRDEDFSERTSFAPLWSGPLGLLSQAILLTNNVGELLVEGNRLQHRLWHRRGDQVRALPPVAWSRDSWPV